ncbi:MAG: PorV/PorQ family protein [Candidatus Eisenbacteria bacterium]
MSAARGIRTLVCAVVLTSAAHDAQAAGTAAGSFLSVGAGASVLSMSGATLASGRDLAASSWNVASLARVDALEFALSHSPLPGGAMQDWLAAGGRVGAGQTRWSVTALFHQEGNIEGRDATNQSTGSVSVSDLALAARFARPMGAYLSAGAGAEWVHEALAGSSGSGLAFDAGVRADMGAFGVALAARHLGGGMNYGGVRYDLPGVIAAGVSWTDAVHGLRLNADLESPTHYYRGVRVGGEWLLRDWMALRTGYRRVIDEPATEQLSGATFGLGTGVGNMWMDYAYAPSGGEGSGQHRLGLTFRPGHNNADMPGGESRRVTQPEPAPRAPKPARVQAVVAPRVSEPAKVETPKVEQPKVEQLKPELPKVEPPKPEPVPPVTPAPVKADVAKPEAAKPQLVQPQPEAAKPAPVAAAPTTPAVAEVKPPPASLVAPIIIRPSTVVVAAGETLATLAKRWDTTVPALMMANDLVREQVTPGTRLKLPPARKR